jgi:hypothetical protein
MAEELPYKTGTIKLTWIDPRNYKFLESKMFDTVEQALLNVPTFLKQGDFLIFKLVETDGNQYRWELLNYGRSNEYINGMKFRDNKALYYGTMGLAVLGAIFLIKFVIKRQ